jgi:Reverse transcriptase (RNA-dependent DNA polymerase)./Integrase core domain.
LNLTYFSQLPYLQSQDYFILLDTGSSINLISKNYVYQNKEQFEIHKEDFEFNTATGKTSGKEYIIMNVEKIPIKCFLFNFHENFNILIGAPSLKELKVIWNVEEDLVRIKGKQFKLKYFKNNNDFKMEVQKIEIRSNHLNSQEKFEIEKLIKEFHDIFPKEGDILSHTSVIKHKINTTDEIPIYTRQYRYPQIYKEEIEKQVTDLLEKDVIQQSFSPWSSPVWMVPKKLDASNKQKFRMVIDYRKLNAKTIDDKFPIPNITEVLDKLGKNTYFTTLDLTSGFHQIQMENESIPKTAFNTDSGHFEFKRMPFGLKNAPATFQRAMNYVLRNEINKTCLVYLDDIIILGTSLQEHINNIRRIFQILRTHNLKIQLDKSEFLMKEVAYLGHLISEKGTKPNPNKITAVKIYPIPKTTKEIKAYLGLLGYYRKFIPNFAKLTKPLTNCLKKGNKIDINDENYKQSFEESKTLLINAPILQYPDFEKTFTLTTDASNYALGAVLSQNIDGKDLPIAYASRTLNTHEINYSTVEKELLSIVWSTKYFRPYLYGKKFIIQTDHRPLVWLMSLKDPNSKLLRWKIKLDEYNFEIKYKEGKLNTNADALSRVRTPMEIIETQENIFERENNLVHCISNDKMLSKGFAEQVDSRYQSKEYLKGRQGKLIPQPINKNKKIFHLVTKEKYYDKPTLKNISECLIELRDYCINNDVFEIHMPRICSGLDKFDFNIIHKKISEIFKETHMKIYIHNRRKEINVNDNASIAAQIDEDDDDLYQTLHSDDENEVNNITFKEGCINVGKNQIVICTHNNDTEIRIKKLFKNEKQRFEVKLDRRNLDNEIKNFIKEYLIPNYKYLCLMEENLHINFGKILMETFHKESYKIVKCECVLEDIESIEEQTQILITYHEGKTNHRGILETYQKLKRRYYWPNAYQDIQKTINNCETCQNNKYERRPFQINENITETPNKPFQKINIDTLTLERKKYLTIIDQFSKFAQIYYLRNLNATSIVNKLIDYFNQYTVPDEITFDAGTEFNNNLVKELLKMHKITPHTTCISNPKSNGAIERFHCTLIEHLRILNQRTELKNVNKKKKKKKRIDQPNNEINPKRNSVR